MVDFSSSEDHHQPPQVVIGGRKFPGMVEVEDSLEDDHGPFLKKHKQFSPHDQFTGGNNLFPVPPSQYNPLDEPSPLGLRLRKSPSLLELIQMRLSQGSSTLGPVPSDDFKNQDKIKAKNNGASVVADKLKASNFPASFLKIGSWEYSSQYEGDLVAKCYYAKHKLVWEILEGGLKSKIEIQWSDIMGLKANLPDDAPATLIVVLARQPLFYRETNPQPRKHTLWQATADFTDGQASLHRKHFLQVPNGLLNKHFEKLILCDTRLNYLSRQEITLDPLFFESQSSVFDDSKEFHSQGLGQRQIMKGPLMSIFEDIATPSVSQSSSISIKQEDTLHGSTETLYREAASPSSVMDMRAIESSKSSESGELNSSKSFEQLIMKGIRPSMSMTDLVNHIGNCISEDPTFTGDKSESRKMLGDIAQHLFGDFQFTTCSDEKSVMARVNSLCSLIQRDGTPVQSFDASEEGKDARPNPLELQLMDQGTTRGGTNAPEVSNRDVSGCKQVPGMPRVDSFGDLLLHLPRIASLPKFLFDISEDGDNQAL